MSLKRELRALRIAAKTAPPPEERGYYLQLVDSGPPYADLFFSELTDPAWLADLTVGGYFERLPTPIQHDDGSVSYPRSLPLHGLTRLAPHAPTEVAHIISDLPVTENLNTGDQLMRCMAEIQDPKQVHILLPVAQRLASNKSRSTRLFLRDLLKSWMAMNCEEETLALFKSFLDGLIGTEAKIYQDPQTVREIEDCDKYVLVPISESSPAAIATICYEGLRSYYAAFQSNSKLADVATDDWLEEATINLHLHHWFDDFRRPNIRRDNIGSILAHRFYSVLGPIYANSAADRTQFDKKLRTHPWKLFQHIRWQLYADHPKETIEYARKDVLMLIPELGRSDRRHGFEFASLLENQSTSGGYSFLTVEEVAMFVNSVLNGPIEDSGEHSQDENFRRHFWRRQLWPIRVLLPDEMKTELDDWTASLPRERGNLELEDYKPFRSLGTGGFVRDKSPFSVDQLASLTNSALWNELNNWKPTNRWIENDDLTEESAKELARTFTDLLATNPSRFSVGSLWWKELNRPAMLSAPLERWAELLKPKEETSSPEDAPTVDLDVAFAVAEHVVSMSHNVPALTDEEFDSRDEPDWNQARLAVAHFLGALQYRYREPQEWDPRVKELLLALATGKEHRLDSLSESEHHDWQFEAINSVRGEAWDGIIRLALNRKNYPTTGTGSVPEWIPSLLHERLTPTSNESPAIFSLLGSNLRLLSYLLPDWLKANADLILPHGRPSCLTAIIIGHLAYDQPYKAVIDALPLFLDRALDSAARLENDKELEPAEKTTDFSSRLGFHIVFYTWNDCFQERTKGDALVSRFLTIACPTARAETIGYIGSVFEKAESNVEIESLIIRAQTILDQWLQWIQDSVKADPGRLEGHESELGRIADLVTAECFPFKWRIEVATTALGMLSHPRWSFQLLDTLEQWSEQEETAPERVVAGISLLAALTGKMSDDLRWSIQTRRLVPILMKGLRHNDPKVREQTNQITENLLRHGFFELLDLSDSATS